MRSVGGWQYTQGGEGGGASLCAGIISPGKISEGENFATLVNPKTYTASRTHCTAKASRFRQGKFSLTSLNTSHCVQTVCVRAHACCVCVRRPALACEGGSGITIGGCILAHMPLGSSRPLILRLPPNHWPQVLSVRAQAFSAHAHGDSCRVAWLTDHFLHLGRPMVA